MLFYLSVPTLDESYEIIEITKNERKENFKFIIKSRGLNYKKAYLTNQKGMDTINLNNSSYIYNTFPLFVKREQDSLIIYTYKKAIIPKNIQTNIRIKQVELSNPNMMNLYDSYKKEGIILID